MQYVELLFNGKQNSCKSAMGGVKSFTGQRLFAMSFSIKNRNKSGILKQSLALDLNYGNCWY
jgi:hypothetical protein